MEKDHALYLTLSPDFGGTKFGPFEQVEVLLGSDPDSDITIPETFGVSPEHAKVTVQDGLGVLISPVAQTTPVYIWKGDSARPKQIATPVAVKPGDSFSLVSSRGPKFTIEIDLLPEHILEERNKFKGPNVTQDQLKKEAKRQIWVKILTSYPGQLITTAWWMIKTGEIFRPRNIFLAATIGGGYVFGIVASCGQADTEESLEAATERIESLEEDVGLANQDNESITMSDYLEKVTGIIGLRTLLVAPEETDLNIAVREQARALLNSADSLSWLTDTSERAPKRSAFMSYRSLVAGWDSLDSGTRTLLAWTGLGDNWRRSGGEVWAMGRDSANETACRKGVGGISWLQASAFQINTRLDVAMTGDPTRFDIRTEDGLEFVRGAMRQYAYLRVDNADERFPILNPENLAVAEFEEARPSSGSDLCISIAGEDDRDRPNRLASALEPGSAGVPEDSRETPVAGIAKFFAGDIRGVDYRGARGSGPDFSSGIVEGLGSLSSDEQAWVINQTAATIARAAILPCIAAVQHPGEDDTLQIAGFIEGDEIGEQLPAPLHCIILEYLVEHGNMTR
jgi:hypothetical protein